MDTVANWPSRASTTAAGGVMAPTKTTSIVPTTEGPHGNLAENRANAHAARAAMREQRLRAHPHADVRGPELVVCRLCEQQIKLSTKSAYDAFHWNKHIERCARRAPAAREQRVMRAAERKKRVSAPKVPVQRLTIHLRPKGNTEASTSDSPPAPVHVKEETPERTEDTPSPSSPRSPSSPPLETPSPPPPAAAPSRPEPDLTMEDYYRRSRRRGTREMSPFTLEAAAAWTWSQVKEPVWVVRSYPSSESQDSGSSFKSERDSEPSGVTRTSDVNEAWYGDFSPTRAN